MISVPMRPVMDWARKVSAGLRADDPRFQHWVYLVHEEATVLMFRSAFMMPYPEEPGYVGIFTEHHEFHVYPRDELRGVWEFSEVQHFPGT
jgi:hypothetical protein